MVIPAYSADICNNPADKGKNNTSAGYIPQYKGIYHYSTSFGLLRAITAIYGNIVQYSQYLRILTLFWVNTRYLHNNSGNTKDSTLNALLLTIIPGI